MKKSSIVYFCIACIFLIGASLMAFIYSPVTLLFLLPSAIFFRFGKEVFMYAVNKVKCVLKKDKTDSEQSDKSDNITSEEEPAEKAKPEDSEEKVENAEVTEPEQKTMPEWTQSDSENGRDVRDDKFNLTAVAQKVLINFRYQKARNADDETLEEIKKKFDNLDMMTTSAIAIMLCETKNRAASPYLKRAFKPDIRPILLRFCRDTYAATDIVQIEKLFCKAYYMRKVKKYLSKMSAFVRKGISDSLPKGVSYSRARKQRNVFVEKICESIGNFDSVKYTPALSGNEELSDSKRNYKLDHLNHNYKDALIYLVDILLTCTCISKMLFVERMIDKMDENSEFYKIIRNMEKSIVDHNVIINKSRPLYKQYYQSELGHLHGDDLLYGLAVTIMINRIKKSALMTEKSKETSAEIVPEDIPLDARGFEQSMRSWLDTLAEKGNIDDIGTLILQRITTTIKDNFNLLTDSLQKLTSWESYYNQRVAFYEKEEDRKRYLTGDF